MEGAGAATPPHLVFTTVVVDNTVWDLPPRYSYERALGSGTYGVVWCGRAVGLASRA